MPSDDCSVPDRGETGWFLEASAPVLQEGAVYSQEAGLRAPPDTLPGQVAPLRICWARNRPPSTRPSRWKLQSVAVSLPLLPCSEPTPSSHLSCTPTCQPRTQDLELRSAMAFRSLSLTRNCSCSRCLTLTSRLPWGTMTSTQRAGPAFLTGCR